MKHLFKKIYKNLVRKVSRWLLTKDHSLNSPSQVNKPEFHCRLVYPRTQSSLFAQTPTGGLLSWEAQDVSTSHGQRGKLSSAQPPLLEQRFYLGVTPLRIPGFWSRLPHSQLQSSGSDFTWGGKQVLKQIVPNLFWKKLTSFTTVWRSSSQSPKKWWMLWWKATGRKITDSMKMKIPAKL